MNTDTTDNKKSVSELIEKIDVQNTPFTVLRNIDKWSVLMGKYRLSVEFDTQEEAEQDARREDWERMLQVMGVMIKEFKPEI